MKPLAFIIITYNRPHDMLELLKNIVQLDKASDLLQDVIIVNNASTEDYSQVEAYAKTITNVPVTWINSSENLGVARGRNFAIQKSNAPVFILLDDDAVLQNKNCLANLIQEFNTHNTNRPKAIISFKVLYYDTLQIQKNALPHKRFEEFKDKDFFETYFYAGGAHAIKREVLEKVGNYPPDFFYGMEEYDLSYRILNAGYSIVYSDKIVKKDKLRMRWVNQSKVAWRYLPKRYFISTALMWSFQYLRMTGFNIRGFFLGWREISLIKKTEKRNTITNETLHYLKSLKARLWF